MGVCLGALAAPALASANLVTNGDFHTGDFTGWSGWVTTAGGTANNGGAPVVFNHFAVFNAGQTTGTGEQGGALEQTVNIPKSGTYTLREDLQVYVGSDVNDPDCGTFVMEFADVAGTGRDARLGPCNSLGINSAGVYYPRSIVSAEVFSNSLFVPAGSHTLAVGVNRSYPASNTTPKENITDIAVGPAVTRQFSCSPSPAVAGEPTICTVTLTDQVGLGYPTGTVNFGYDWTASNASGYCVSSTMPVDTVCEPPSPTYDQVGGNFNPMSCVLGQVAPATSSCSVTYTPSSAGSPYTMFATYSGDPTYLSELLTFEMTVNPAAQPPATPPPEPLGPTPPGPLGTTHVSAAVISNATESHRVWREPNNPRLTTISKSRPPVGTTFSFSLDKSAAILLYFQRQSIGRLVRGRCVAQARRNAHRQKCTLPLPSGTVSLAGHAGINRVHFEGRLPTGKQLAPGDYVVVIAAMTPGAEPTEQRLRFTIVK